MNIVFFLISSFLLRTTTKDDAMPAYVMTWSCGQSQPELWSSTDQSCCCWPGFYDYILPTMAQSTSDETLVKRVCKQSKCLYSALMR